MGITCSIPKLSLGIALGYVPACTLAVHQNLQMVTRTLLFAGSLCTRDKHGSLNISVWKIYSVPAPVYMPGMSQSYHAPFWHACFHTCCITVLQYVDIGMPACKFAVFQDHHLVDYKCLSPCLPYPSKPQKNWAHMLTCMLAMSQGHHMAAWAWLFIRLHIKSLPGSGQVMLVCTCHVSVQPSCSLGTLLVHMHVCPNATKW